MKPIVFLISFFVLICSCKNNNGVETKTGKQQFDKIKWRTKEDNEYPHRNDMLDDLINNVRLKGLKNTELVNLLGAPDRVDNGHLFYRIAQKRIAGFPLSTKTLVIKLTSDSIVEWRKIHGG